MHVRKNPNGGRAIVNVVFTKEQADEVVAFYRPAGNTRGEDRHPRVFKRTVRAEHCASWLYVVTADALAKEAIPAK